MSNADAVLEGVAAPAVAPKKVRKPKFEADGTPPEPTVPKEKKVRAPKMVEQLDAEGNPVLDAEGNPVMVEAPKKERAPKLDADGNPLPRKSNVSLESQVLKITEKGILANYREGSKRGDIFRSIKDGMTVGEFYALNGGKSVSHTFLVWYVNEAEVVSVE